MIRGLLRKRIVRFAIVGVGNTAVNFLILNLAFYALGQAKIVSSILATIGGMTFSFVCNRTYVFADKRHPVRQAIPFIAVAASGALLVQNAVFALGVFILRGHESTLMSTLHALSGIRLRDDFISINLSNLIATLCVMVWNYNGYRLFVFRSTAAQNNAPLRPDIS